MQCFHTHNRVARELDKLIELIISSAASPGVRIKIEATVIRDRPSTPPQSQKDVPDQVTLDTIDLDSVRRHAAHCSACHHVDEPVHGEDGGHLPSPITSDSHSPRVLQSPQQQVPYDVETVRPAEISAEETPNAPTRLSNRRRKTVGGLSIPRISTVTSSLSGDASSLPTTRQLQTGHDHFRKRRRLDIGPKLEQSTVDKLIEGIWKELHNPNSLVLDQKFPDILKSIRGAEKLTTGAPLDPNNFDLTTNTCRQITEGARTGRALEVIMQAHWVDSFDVQLASLADSRIYLKPSEQKRATLAKACELFKWSEKELRNRMAIWKGYRDIKNAAGWSALIFAGPGIYRFCKYRLGLDPDALVKLRGLKTRFEVAADTLHPDWRKLLPIVGDSPQLHWRGHPHSWVVSKRKDPLPLAFTYRQWDTNFSFRHITESEVDKQEWGDQDPRRLEKGPDFLCELCSQCQSVFEAQNECVCFAELFGVNAPKNTPVQVFQTENGRNNGLIACSSFARGIAIGEYVGLITKGLANTDVMQSQVRDHEPYQIWQGRSGNFTRFINHSCEPNCQFQTFSWLGIQRMLVISKGVSAGKELTVDYSSRYWEQLDKKCLCGSARCRYARRPSGIQQTGNDLLQ